MKRTEEQMKGRGDDAIRSQQQANAFTLSLHSSDKNSAEDQLCADRPSSVNGCLPL